MKTCTPFLIFLLVIGFNISLAQNSNPDTKKVPSYIILLYGDTLYGNVKTDVSGHVKFKNGESSRTEKYRQDELIGYYSGKKNQTFITINPDDDNHGPWLYERKATGIIKMYTYTFTGPNGGRLPYYYVEKGSSGLQRVLKGSVTSIKKEKDILRNFMGDNEELLAELKKSGWNEKNLLNIINQYNEWYALEDND
jgi:hypothetical protein